MLCVSLLGWRGPHFSSPHSVASSISRVCHNTSPTPSLCHWISQMQQFRIIWSILPTGAPINGVHTHTHTSRFGFYALLGLLKQGSGGLGKDTTGWLIITENPIIMKNSGSLPQWVLCPIPAQVLSLLRYKQHNSRLYISSLLCEWVVAPETRFPPSIHLPGKARQEWMTNDKSEKALLDPIHNLICTYKLPSKKRRRTCCSERIFSQQPLEDLLIWAPQSIQLKQWQVGLQDLSVYWLATCVDHHCPHSAILGILHILYRWKDVGIADRSTIWSQQRGGSQESKQVSVSSWNTWWRVQNSFIVLSKAWVFLWEGMLFSGPSTSHQPEQWPGHSINSLVQQILH